MLYVKVKKKSSACIFPSFESYISTIKYVIVSALAKKKKSHLLEL